MAFLSRVGIAPLLALSTGAAALVLTLGLVKVIGDTAARQVESDIGQSLAELAFQTSDKLDRGMYERYREVQLMAERYEITSKEVPVEVKRAVLNSMQETYPYYAWIGLTDTSGKVKVSTKGMLEGANVSARPWYSAAYGGKHLTDVHEAVLLAKLLPNPTNEPKRFFDVAFPYHDQSGEVAGVLGTHLSWQWARDIEESVLQPVAKRRLAETLIVSQSGKVLLGPKDYQDPVKQLASFARASKKQNGFVSETWPDGKRYLVGYSKSEGFRNYPGLNWVVLVRQDLDTAYLPVYQLRTKVLWSGVAASFLIATLLWLLARRVTGSLRTLTSHADALRLGKQKVIPPVDSHLTEVDILESAINALLRDVQAKEQGLREMNVTLEARVRERTADLHRAVEETRYNERRIRAIIDTALDAFVGMDGRGLITDWNPRAEEIFGWKRDEVMGRSVAEVIVPNRFKQGHEQGMKRFAVSGSSGVVGQRLQLSAVRRDGEEFPVEMTIGQIDAGEAHFFGAFIQDISERKRIEDELARERELLNTVLETIDVGVVTCSQDGEITMFNRAARDLHGLPAERIPPEQWAQHYDLFDSDGKTRLTPERIPLFRALSGENVRDAEMTVHPKNARAHFLLASGRAIYGSGGEKIGAVVAMKDVTDLKESERRLEANERLLRTITDNLPVLIAYIDQDERYQFANATYEKWFGLSTQQMVGKTVKEVLGDALYEEGREFLTRNLNGEHVRFESAAPGPSGERFVEVVGIPDNQNGHTRGVYVLTSDITAAKQHQQELNRLARIDTLTGLPNRRSYLERLPEALQRVGRTGRGLALMFLDVDHFKQINDTLGHAGGDAVLQEFAHRLKTSVRTTDIVSRLAGDEFTIVLEGLHDAQEALLVAAKIVKAFQIPMQVNQTSRNVSTSIGIAFTMDKAMEISILSQQADAALYRAKANGRGQYALFEVETTSALSQ